MKKSALKSVIKKAIDEYNAYRSPEVIAKLIEINEENITVEFKGPFCKSCGIYDYFEDLIYELKNLTRDIEIEIKSIEGLKDEAFIVKYKLKQ
jgi:hypothetical protein